MRWRPDLHPHVVPSEGVFLLGESGSVLLREPLFVAVAPFLGGEGQPTSEIVRQLHGRIPPAEVYYALGLLQQKGYVWGDDEPPSAPEIAVAIRAFGRTDAQSLTAAFAQHAIAVREDAPLLIALTDDYLRPELAELNREALASGRPWLLVRPWGREIWLGPHFVPHQTACWACLAPRLRGQRHTERYLQERLGTSEPLAPATPNPTHEIIAAGLVAGWVKGLGTGDGGQVGGFSRSLTILNPATWQSEAHPVAKRPQCPACGQPDWVAIHQSQPPHFEAQAKVAGEWGRPSADRLPELEPLLSKVTGLVGRLHSQQHGPAHVYTAEVNFALPLADLGRLRRTLRGRSGGKGLTEAQAKLGALAESIERYAGLAQGDEPFITAKVGELEGAVHPHELLQFSERQYAERAQWNGRDSLFNYVPEPFDDQQPIAWSKVWEVGTARPRYIPTALAYYGIEAAWGRADSNGCAAGGTLAEAFVQGFCELVERDSVALWWYNRVARPGVDLASFGQPYLEQMVAYHAQIGRELWVVDVTADLGVPTFAAVSRRTESPEQMMMGFGAHLSAQSAVLRAVAELNQLLPAVLGQQAINDPEAGQWWQEATLANQPYLAADPAQPLKTAADYVNLAGDDWLADVETCVRLANGRGLTPLVLDQTRPDAPLKVVRVVVPGLRHFWARFGRGRLYDVPVALGWVGKPTAEAALNPIPMFL
ncbi:MAG: TOMM precursor leader peptide-binding protein [Chloroflexi bacterium]|nr:TOMM precursor leader peptide-binding protein [Chloroflexota bacterium]